MFYHLLYPLKDLFFGFNVFRYITFRAAGGAVTAFCVSLLLGPIVIRRLQRFKVGETIRRRYVPTLYPLHANKEGIPTMGGILILASILIATLLWAKLTNRYILMALGATIWLGVIGFADDHMKFVTRRARELGALTKLTSQIILGLSIGLLLFFDPDFSKALYIPFFKEPLVVLWVLPFILFVVLVIVGSSNAVNLTDGLDGLAIGCVIMAAIAYAGMSYVTGHFNFSHYLRIPYVPGSGELAIFCASIVGAGLGFLWYNCFPATIFMGDTGSLALGGAIGVVAVLIKKELVLLIVGGVFVAEALSVILQVASFKFRGRRIFQMAPLHHHFQLRGWSESKVTIRFWIAAAIFALLSISTFKLR